MKVLICYGTDLQIAIISGLVECLKRNGIDAMAWNRYTFRTFSNNDKAFKNNLHFFNRLKCLHRLIKRLLYYIPLLRLLFVKMGFRDIDIVNYHSHDELCDKFFPFFQKDKMKLIISIWGSDLYRISDQTRRKREVLYPKVDLIHVESPGVRNDFLCKYHVEECRVVSCNYGIELFNKIDAFRNDKEKIKKDFLPDDAKNRVIVTCGYNGRRGQQHKMIVKQLLQLPLDYKKKIYIVFPLTYTVPGDSFLEEIDDLLKDLDIPYYCFKDHLDENNLAKLRILSDVVINTQITDSLSTSLIEYFYSGNIMLLGEWLPYDFLEKDFHINYIPISSNNIAEKLCYILDNYKFESQLAISNIKRTYSLASWDNLTPRFGEIFQRVYNS